MANLKELKNRISSVKSTQKITSAMKMVAASRLKRAQEAAENARPYAERMNLMVNSILANYGSVGGAPSLLTGNGSESSHLLLVITSDRGLCGGFNSNVGRAVKDRIVNLENSGSLVKVVCVGRKGRDLLKGVHESKVIETYEGMARDGVKYGDAKAIVENIIQMFDAGEFDVCTIFYNKFVSVISQVVTTHQIIPVQNSSADTSEIENEIKTAENRESLGYEFEPSEQEILEELLPNNLTTQVFRALLESSASEHGARMSAMDNATRNAGEMIDGLTLTFNRTRQAKITSELIEIISGAEAL